MNIHPPRALLKKYCKANDKIFSMWKIELRNSLKLLKKMKSS